MYIISHSIHVFLECLACVGTTYVNLFIYKLNVIKCYSENV